MNNLKVIIFVISILCPFTFIIGQTYINELMASNQLNSFDDFFESDDWVELYHEGGILNLEGHFLSDRLDSLTKWYNLNLRWKEYQPELDHASPSLSTCLQIIHHYILNGITCMEQ